MKQTAMQSLLVHLDMLVDRVDMITAQSVIDLISESYLDLEREQIEDAFQDGKWNGHESARSISEMKDPTEYYNETYGKI